MSFDWLVDGATKDSQRVDAAWRDTSQPLIDGVMLREARTVLNEDRALTEIYRKDWGVDALPVEQVFQVRLEPGAVSAWHAHAFTTDRLFASSGAVRVALYDARRTSPTFGRMNHFIIGELRPCLIVIPPGVWHGVQNSGSTPALLLNLVDHAYDYADPDHWRVPSDSPAIPFRW